MSGRPPTYWPNLTKTERSATSCAQTGRASAVCSHDHARSSAASEFSELQFPGCPEPFDSPATRFRFGCGSVMAGVRGLPVGPSHSGPPFVPDNRGRPRCNNAEPDSFLSISEIDDRIKGGLMDIYEPSDLAQAPSDH